MDLGNSAESAAAVLGLIVGISLALGKAFGGPLMHIVEAVKATRLISDGYGGVVTILVGILVGVALGVLVDALAADDYSMLVWILLGAFAGLIMSADAMSTYKAAAQVNPTPSSSPRTVVVQEDGGDVHVQNDLDHPEDVPPPQGEELRYARTTGQKLGQVRSTPQEGLQQGVRR